MDRAHRERGQVVPLLLVVLALAVAAALLLVAIGAAAARRARAQAAADAAALAGAAVGEADAAGGCGRQRSGRRVLHDPRCDGHRRRAARRRPRHRECRGIHRRGGAGRRGRPVRARAGHARRPRPCRRAARPARRGRRRCRPHGRGFSDGRVRAARVGYATQACAVFSPRPILYTSPRAPRATRRERGESPCQRAHRRSRRSGADSAAHGARIAASRRAASRRATCGPDGASGHPAADARPRQGPARHHRRRGRPGGSARPCAGCGPARSIASSATSTPGRC